MQHSEPILIQHPCLANDSGLLNPDGVFQPFGPIPLKGSGLFIGTRDWLNKNISNIIIQLHWCNLPADFSDHYKEYSNLFAFSNASFKVSFFVLHNTVWHSVSPEPVPLFEEKDGVLLPISTFHLRVNKELFMPDTTHGPGPLLFNSFERDGFIQMKLSEPEAGFGSGLYSNAIITTNLENEQGMKKETPQPPFAPMADKIRIEYS